MSDPLYLLAGVLISGAITWSLRAVPFVMIAPLRRSELIRYLGDRMPVGIMLILTIYTLRGISFGDLASGPSALVALAVTVGLQLWRRNMMLSIFAGTAVHVALASGLASTLAA